MYNFLKPFFIYITFIYLNSAYAQNENPGFVQSLSVDATIHYGFYFPGNVKTDYVIDSRPFLGEIDVSLQTNGKKIWQQINGYPAIGLCILYGSSGGDKYVGNIGAILPFINLPLYKGSLLTLNCKFGLGPGWVQKPFNAETNYKDFVIGSHLNACIALQVLTALQIERHTQAHIGLSFTHFSNGSIKLPNLGLNTPALTAGVEYSFGSPPVRIKRPLTPLKRRWDYYLFIMAAVKESTPLESPVRLVNLLSFEVTKDFSYSGRYGAGINLTYDRALSKEIPNSPTFAFDESSLKLEASIYGTYEYIVGNLSFPVQLGFYLYNNYKFSEIYENIGIRYRLGRHWTVAALLKSHLGNGDFIQWGVGYKF
jgi:Lipid A 3-O-deacylase (PagL)